MYIRPTKRELYRRVKRLAIVGGLFLAAVLFASMAHSKVLAFTSDWCKPCQQMYPIIKAAQDKGADIRSVDTDREPELARRYDVKGIPCFVAVDGEGRELARRVGIITVEELQHLIDGADGRKYQVTPMDQHAPWSDERVVKIRNHDEGGAFGWLSGAVVSLHGEALYVITCAHGLKGPGDPVVVLTSDGRTTIIGDVVETDAAFDCGLIRLRGAARSKFFTVAAAEPVKGDRLYLAGFPNAKNWRGRWSQLVDFQTWYDPQVQKAAQVMVAAGAAIEGESGGPAVSTGGQLVGVVHSTDGKATFCCRLTCLRNFLDRVLPGRPGAIIPRADAPPPSPAPPEPDIAPPASPPTPEPTPDTGAWLGKIEAAIAALESGKQDKGQYLQAGDIPAPPDLSGFATKNDMSQAQSQWEKLAMGLPGAIDQRVKEAGIGRAATSILGVPSWLALPAAVVSGPLGVGLSLAAMVGYRRLKKRISARARGGARQETFRRNGEPVAKY